MSGSVWYISVSKKKIEFKKYSLKQKNKKTVKKPNQKSTSSAKKLLINLLFAFNLIFLLSMVSAAEINDTFHINLQTTYANGSIETGTFTLAFNITESSDSSCLGPIVYNHSVQKTTDTRGIVSLYLPTTGSGGGDLSALSFDKQYYLCYYRDGTLKDVSQLGRVPYAFRATQVNLSEIGVDTDFNMTDYNLTDVKYGFFEFLGSLANRITSLFVEDVDVSGDVNVTGDIRVGGDIDVTGNVSASWFKGIYDWIVGTASQVYLSFNGTQLDFNESQLNQTIDTRISGTGSGLHVNMSDHWNTGDRGALRNISQIQGSWLTNDLSWINFTDGDTRYILITDESDLNVNRSEWWKTAEGDLNDVSDILGSWLTNDLAWINFTEGDTQYLLITDEANLNVNASDYWITDEGVKKNVVDVLGSEITNDLGWINQTQGDVRYVEVSGDTMTGTLNINANLSIGTNVLFVDSNNNVIGIGTLTPQNTLNVVGDINATTNIYGNLIFQNGSQVLDTSTMFDGDVSGTYNVLQLGTGVVGTINLENGSVTAIKIAPNAVNTTHIVDGTILDEDIASGAGIQWSKLSNYPYVIAGVGLTGGGQLSDNRTISVAFSDTFLGWTNLTDYPDACDVNETITVIGNTITCSPISIIESQISDFGDYVPTTRTITAGAGLTGGGNLSEDRSFAVAFGTDLLGWDNLTAYPEGCPTGQAVQVIGDTLTCIDVENATTLEGYPADFFMPLNKSVYGDFNFTGSIDVDGGWTSGGVTIDGGDIYAQTLYVYNISSLEVTHLKINGSLIPDMGGQFDLGSSDKKWRDLWISRDASIGGDLSLTGTMTSGTVPWARLSDHPTIEAGTGLEGGGDLSTNRTLSLTDTGVSAGSYGGNIVVGRFTVDQQGRLTSASNTTIRTATTSVSGITTLTASVATDTNTTAATPWSVKVAYDTATAKASPGNCPAGQVVMNTTTGGVQCVSIGTAQLADGAVTAIKIAPSAVNTTHIVDGTILNEDIASGAGIQWSKLSNYSYIIAGTGLTGGGQLSGNRTISVAFSDTFLGWTNLTDYPDACDVNETITVIGNTITCSPISIIESQISDFGDYVPTTRTITAGTGLTGGGNLSEDRSFAVAFGDDLLGWTNLTDYPDECPAGHAVKQIGDTLTCINISSQGSETLDGYDSTFFMPLNTSVVGNFSFNDGWTGGGLSIIGGDIYAQTLYVYNISSLEVTHLKINGSLIPDVTGSFDLGSSDKKWRDLWISRDASVGGDLALTGTMTSGTVPWLRLSDHPTIEAGTGLEGGGDLSTNRTLSLTGQALAFHNLATNGLVTRTGTDTITTRTITQGDGIIVSNGDGVAANPQISANTTYLQRRVIGTCDSGNAIKIVNADGTVTCESIPQGTMSSWTLAGTSGTPQTISDGQTATIEAGTGITTIAAATRKVTVALTNTGVSAGGYGSTTINYPRFTVDAKGRITSASNQTIRTATTSVSGITTLTASVATDTNTTAATPWGVKVAYDTATAKASPGTCPSGQVVQNTTTGGVQCVEDEDTTYTASGTLLNLTGTTFSVNAGTLTNNKGCKFVTGIGLVCDQDYLTSFTETDPLWTGNQSSYYNKTYVYNVTEIDAFSLSHWTDDLGDRGYTHLTNFTDDILWTTGFNATGDTRWLTSYTETDPLWTGNSSTIARTGNCPAGQVVMNTTTGGVQCVSIGTAQLADGAVTAIKIAPNAVNTTHIVDGTILDEDIATAAGIQWSKLSNYPYVIAGTGLTGGGQLSGNRTISVAFSDTFLGWTNLTAYPEGCPVGQAVQVIGDTLSCIDVTTGTTNGTGVPNYLPRWVTEETLGTSVIYQNGSDIGIGTESPLQKLNVIGDGNFTGNLYGGTVYSGGSEVLTSFTETDPLWTSNQSLVYLKSNPFSFINTTTASNLNYLILSKWANITDAPTTLSFFTDDLGDRGYTHLTNFTDDILWTSGFNATGDSRWLTSYTETDPLWTGNWTNVAFTNIDETFDKNLIVTKNFTVDTDTLFVNSNTNRVGINTTTPQNTLNVVGDINVTQIMYIGNARVFTNGNGDMVFRI